MNTILTDDEIADTLKNLLGYFMAPTFDDRKFARAIEAAVLAKLREQDKRWADRAAHLLNVFDATPQPAVVQVPQGEYQRNVMSSLANWLETRSHTIWAQEGGHEGLMRTYAADLRAMLAAAPEAPAQGEQHCRWCDSCGEGVTTFCRGKTDDCPMFKKAPALPAEVRDPDVADIIAGALGTSRAHAYDLMRDATQSTALPAEVREAIKVAREALAVIAQYPATRADEMSAEAMRQLSRAAIARIDALGGGE